MNNEVIKLTNIKRHFQVGTVTVKALRGISVSIKKMNLSIFVAVLSLTSSSSRSLTSVTVKLILLYLNVIKSNPLTHSAEVDSEIKRQNANCKKEVGN